MNNNIEEQPEPTKDVKEVLLNHREVLIIVADPDSSSGGESESESNIAVFAKLLDEQGVLAPVLSEILQNLLVTKNGKQRSSIQNQTPISA